MFIAYRMRERLSLNPSRAGGGLGRGEPVEAHFDVGKSGFAEILDISSSVLEPKSVTAAMTVTSVPSEAML